MHIFTEIPFNHDIAALDKAPLFFGEIDAVRPLWERCAAAARPVALLKEVEVLHREDGHVISVGGVPMESSVLDRNLQGLHRAFAYVASCGRELEELAEGLRGDERDAAYYFRMQALRCAMAFAHEKAQQLWGTEKISAMNPGSLPEWPISEQKAMFAMLGDVEGSIGVHLKESMMMAPLESSSGLFFASEHDFKNCMACTRKNCVGRQAAYDPAVAGEIRK